MPIVRSVLVGLTVVAVVAVAHVMLSWMDRRGWIYYRSEPRSPLGARSAMALMEFETLFNPAVEHVLEYRRHGDQWVQVGNGDDPDPETASRASGAARHDPVDSER